jgi:hypothetical protein
LNPPKSEVGWEVGISVVSPAVGSLVGWKVGVSVVGPAVGSLVGWEVGISVVGPAVGSLVGWEVGVSVVGPAVGSLVGWEVGVSVVGPAVGSLVGWEVGVSVVGPAVGSLVGWEVGPVVGSLLGGMVWHRGHELPAKSQLRAQVPLQEKPSQSTLLHSGLTLPVPAPMSPVPVQSTLMGLAPKPLGHTLQEQDLVRMCTPG